tara:strand:- start:748 stop:1218 length:471 start_codon:yes stop_codon:yes gene_type:complete
MYDTDYTKYNLKERMGSAEYLLNEDKYYNKSACRIKRGVTGGNNVSVISGNLVDLESDLFGITRNNSLSPNNHYMSNCAFTDMNNCKQDNILIKGTPTTKERVIDTNLESLPECDIINYKPLVTPKPFELNSCNNSQVEEDYNYDVKRPNKNTKSK